MVPHEKKTCIILKVFMWIKQNNILPTIQTKNEASDLERSTSRLSPMKKQTMERPLRLQLTYFFRSTIAIHSIKLFIISLSHSNFNFHCQQPWLNTYVTSLQIGETTHVFSSMEAQREYPSQHPRREERGWETSAEEERTPRNTKPPVGWRRDVIL